MATVFDNFVKWNNVYSTSKVTLANIGADKFNPDKDRQSAALVLEQIAKENGTNNDANIQYILQEGTKDDVKAATEQGKAIYEPQITKLFTTEFNTFYASTPQPVKDEVYTSLDSFKPRSDLSTLTGDTLKAAELHKAIAGMKEKLIKYESEQTSQSEKQAIEKEIKDKLYEHYQETYLDTDEKRARYQDIVNVMKTWAEKSPKIAISRYAKIYHDKKKEFDKLVTKDNLQDYLPQAMDTDEMRKLFAYSNVVYERAEERKRAINNS